MAPGAIVAGPSIRMVVTAGDASAAGVGVVGVPCWPHAEACIASRTMQQLLMDMNVFMPGYPGNVYAAGSLIAMDSR